MTTASFPFDAGPGSTANEADWGKMAQFWLTDGVVAGELNNLQVYADSTGMQVKVKSGKAWIHGYYYESDAEQTIAIAAADATNPRIDRIVVQLDTSSNAISVVRVAGTAAASPTAPALTQNVPGVYQLSLAQVRVNAASVTVAATAITDERHDPQLCGFTGHARPVTGAANLLANGGFLVWQRGTVGFTVSGNYTADRWLLGIGAGSAVTVDREASVIDSLSGLYAMKITYTHVAQSNITQKLENYWDLRGRKVSVYARIKSSAANAVQLLLVDSTGTVAASAFVPASNNYETVLLTGTISAGATSCTLYIQLAASCTAYVAGVMMTATERPVPYIARHPAEDWERCQRYYERHGGIAGTMPRLLGTADANGEYISQSIQFNARKFGTPTLTKVGTWAATNILAQPTVQGASPEGYHIYVQSNAAGAFETYPNSSGHYVEAESNP